MDVSIRRHQSSRTYIFKDVLDVYTKGGLLCLYFKDGKTKKIPLMNIFDIEHGYKEVELAVQP